MSDHAWKQLELERIRIQNVREICEEALNVIDSLSREEAVAFLKAIRATVKEI
jgi:hypothetical protein